MNEQVMKLIGYLVLALALIGFGAAGAWEWQANSYGKQLASQSAGFQTDLTKIVNAGAEQARQAVAKQQTAERALAALDQKATEEKTNALAENQKLADAVAAGNRRLRIAGTCTASHPGSGDVPGTAAGSSLGDAGTIELSPATGSTVLSIRAGIIADQAALRALQSYVMNVCR